MQKFYTCEYVSEGHPDKVCDNIADAILDECLKQDPNSRSAVECSIKTPSVYVFGELTTNANLNIEKIVKDTLKKIGYTNKKFGFDADNCEIVENISKQSSDIKNLVDESESKELGAGDQGMMYGLATIETPNLMPLPFNLARQLIHKLTELRKSGALNYLGPDAKSQVTISYANNKPAKIEKVVVSTQHTEDVSLDQLRKDVLEKVVKPLMPANLEFSEKNVLINPVGKFVIGGPEADSGLTGRKIIVDTYGGIAHHGGGSFSGKDSTKVDRSGAYFARYVAKHIVAAGLADKCEIGVAYVIGIPEPCMISIETFGTAKVSEDKIEQAVKKVFNFSPSNIIKELELQKPIFFETANKGHFGIENQKWEQLDKNKIEKLKELTK